MIGPNTIYKTFEEYCASAIPFTSQKLTLQDLYELQECLDRRQESKNMNREEQELGDTINFLEDYNDYADQQIRYVLEKIEGARVGNEPEAWFEFEFLTDTKNSIHHEHGLMSYYDPESGFTRVNLMENLPQENLST